MLPLIFIFVMLLRSPMLRLLLTSSLRGSEMSGHTLLCVSICCAVGRDVHPSVLENSLPFSLFSLEFWSGPASVKSRENRIDPLIFFSLLLLSFYSVFWELFIFQLFTEIIFKMLLFSQLFLSSVQSLIVASFQGAQHHHPSTGYNRHL